MPAYLLFATPRSGSHLLCEHLAATGRAGCPDEYLSRRWRACAAQNGIEPLTSPTAYLRLVVDHFSTANATFGLKVMWQHFADLSEGLRAESPEPGGSADLADVLASWCGGLRVVWIRRHDKLGQALSYWRAVQTGSWSRYTREDGPLQADAQYDFGAIAELGRTLVEEERTLQGYLAARRLPLHEVWYEDLVVDPLEATRGVLDHLGESWPEELTYPSQRLERQSDALTEEWRTRFVAQLARGPSAGPVDGARQVVLTPTPG